MPLGVVRTLRARGMHVSKARAEIAWQDKRGNVGIRFVKLAPRVQRVLQLWLAQQYFAN